VDELPSNALGLDASVYLAAIDTVLREREALFRASEPNTVTVLGGTYAWPMLATDDTLPPDLGPLPIVMPSLGSRRGLTIRLADTPSTATRPFFILGPLDYMGADRAMLRVNLVHTETGQVLYRLIVRRTGGAWRAEWVMIELQS